MKRTDLSEPLQKLLKDTHYVTIATVSAAGDPLATPLYGVFDDNLTLYWASDPDSQHSRNITHNGKLFATLFNSQAPSNEVIGLYFEMNAKKLTTRAAVGKARKHYATDFGEDGTHHPFIGHCARRLYAAKPLAIYINGESAKNGQYIDIKTPLST